jgi:internalin A
MNEQELFHIIEEASQNKITTLDLSSKELKRLPSEIGQLTQLSELYLSGNKLVTLPSEIGQLTHLNELDLSSNQLTTLPSEIGQLTHLNELDLRSNQLTTLPPEIGQLTHLNELDLRSNQLTTLPPEIGQLTQLNTLYLSYNQLTDLPSEIGQLAVLNKLHLRSNRLTTLPPEIGKLIRLSSFHLSNNQLETLPTEIGQLTSLIELHLLNNQLEALPTEIGRLHPNQLTLDDNPLTLLPPEIREKGFREILNFYRQQLEQDVDYLYEAKLLIVGEAGAGKTTLAKKIQNPDYQLKQDEISTEGIDIAQWYFLMDNGKEFRVNIWDFGGQEIYYATHKFFLTNRSFYVLVADSRTEDTDFYYWLNVVELLSNNSPLLIVKNEKQDRQRSINEQQLHKEFASLKGILATNLATNRNLPAIFRAIKYHIEDLSHVGTELPKSWVKVREALEGNPRNYISQEEYLQICQNNGFTALGDKLQLSSYLHDLGVCLHFQNDDLLKETVILKPSWGTDAVYSNPK